MHRYDTSVDPPAASLTIKVTNPETGHSSRLQAKIDSGAAMSVLPHAAVTNLALEPMGENWASGYDRRVTRLPTYDVALEVEGYTVPDIEVAVSAREDVLLGRDLLNHFILTLDGKNLAFELEDP